jgi:large subunit ribosomal protein L32e
MPINKEKLDLRAEVVKKRPKFKRAESWRYKRLETTWRKPKGVDNHQRKQKSRGRPGIVKVGYGGPKITRGLHPSGYTDNLVFTINDLKKLNPKTDGIRFGHTVGARKRKEIIIKAIEKKFKIFNARVSGNAGKP